MSEFVYAGLTNQSIDLFIEDSSSTVGAGLAGLAYTGSGITPSGYYRKGALGSSTPISLANLATVGSAWTSGGFKEVDPTGMKGIYRFDLLNAMVDTEGFTSLYMYGATNMAPLAMRIDCRPLPADVQKVVGSAPAASGLRYSAHTIVLGTVGAGSTATSVVTSACDPTGIETNQFSGRTLIFRSSTATPALRGQARAVTSSTNSPTPTFTVANLTTIPSSGDVFVIV
jgi:hypothetical protein